MADSAGQIGLDLVVNQNGFNKQMQGITGLAKKAGVALAGAFAVKKLVDFGAQCIELGSDLAEVQNVVDVTFTSMSSKVNEFAQNAATSFGLSETMTKRYVGTFGAMAKAFGFTEGAAYNMSTTLTGLAGDVASFYNIRQDEAYTKLKSVFTGETESLKDLGVVMTQTALDQFALANGFGKTTAKMSEAEKVALRYAFVQKQLATASGDFARTSDGWANQVRILKLQFDSLKATLGQGFINLFTPIIQGLNNLIGKLQGAANAFKSFTELITGKKSSDTGGVGNIAVDAGAAADGLDGVTDAAKKAAKAASALGIDELNIVNPEESSGGAGADVTSADLAGQMADATENAVTRTGTALDAIKGKLEELSKIYMEGFKTGLGDVDFSKVVKSVDSAKKSLEEIFTAPEVMTAADTWVNSAVLSFGKITGSAASIGTTVATLLTGSVAGYLEQNSEFIKDRIVGIFDASSRANEIYGNLAVALADIFTVFQSPAALQIGADLIAIFANSFLSLAELGMKFGADLLEAIAQPIIDNKDSIALAIENTLKPIETVVGAIKGFVNNTWETIFTAYDTYIKPALDNFSSGWNTVLSGALDAYNTYLAPTLQFIADGFSRLVSDYIQPLIDAFINLLGRVVYVISLIWEAISPFVSWMINHVVVVISTALQTIWTAVEYVFSLIANAITVLIEVISGIIDFLVGIFTGDWDKAWAGIKKIGDAIWEGIKKTVKTTINLIANTISTVLKTIKDTVQIMLDGIALIFETVWGYIKNRVKFFIDMIQAIIEVVMVVIHDFIFGTLEKISTKFTTIFEGIKDTVSELFNGLWTNMKGTINLIISGIEGLANGVVRGINKVINALNTLKIDVPDWVTTLTGVKSFGFNIPSLNEISIPRLAQGGFVKANTPQLAMIGDNLHQGEIVAPEDKMLEMAKRAAELVNNRKEDSVYMPIIIELLNKIIDILEALDLSLELDGKSVLKGLKDAQKRLGYQF